jgi:hypothetical protein
MRDNFNPFVDYPGDVRSREVSFYGLKPGDSISFEYESKKRFGIVVASKRTQSGYFLSGRLNTLLNVFLLDSITTARLELVINILYKDRSRCVYGSTPAILGSFIGKDNFRTFNVAKIRDIRDYIITK